MGQIQMNRTTKNNSLQIKPEKATVFQIFKPSVITYHYPNFSFQKLFLIPASEVVLNGISKKEKCRSPYSLYEVSPFPSGRLLYFSFSLSLYIYISVYISLSVYISVYFYLFLYLQTLYVYLNLYIYISIHFYISLSLPLLSRFLLL